VRQLDARHRALRADKLGQFSEGQDVLVRPETEVAGGDPSSRRHRGGLDHHQSNPAHGPGPVMDQMPVGGMAVMSRILAHRRHEDAVAEIQLAESEGIEEACHRSELLNG